jgi:hypothetical protein
MSIGLKRGYYTEEREPLVEEIFGDKSLMAVWLFLKSQAGYETRTWREGRKLRMVLPGAMVISQRTASRHCGMSVNTWVNCLRKLVLKKLIVVEKFKNSPTLITLIKKAKTQAKRAFNAVRGAPVSNPDHKELILNKRSYKPYDVGYRTSTYSPPGKVDLGEEGKKRVSEMIRGFLGR